MDEQTEKYPHTHSALTSRGFFHLVALFFLTAVFVGGCDGIYTMRDYLYDRVFVPVADITGIPAGVDAGVPLPLNPVIVPGDATNRAVAWSVSDPGTTGAAITGGVFTAAAKGTAKITARVTDGLWRGQDFVKTFTITVIGEYAVTYHLNGGALDGHPGEETVTETYRIEELPFTLPVPDYGANIFLGWYDSAQFTENPVTAIPAGSIGPREYWARWHDLIDVGMTEQASGVYWSYDSGTKVITIEDGADVTLTGSTTQNRVAVESGAAATVTLQDVTINISGTANAAFDLGDGATVTLLLSGTNALTSGGAAAGVHVTAGRTLVIDSAGSDGAGTASSSHAVSGTLTATGGSAGGWSNGGAGAGIGGSTGEEGGSITIAGGTVTAQGAYTAAGIGGGDAGNGGTISILGGTVNATGGQGGAGIGGGYYGSSGSITISDGTVTATGDYSAGIGGGYYGPCGTITISGGEITAAGGYSGPGIGSGHRSSGGTVDISGGIVSATGGTSAAGIGGGYRGSVDSITISGGTVAATGWDNGAGIGGGTLAGGGTISINSPTGTSHGTATARRNGSINYGSSIGPGYNGSGGSFFGPNGETSWPGGTFYSW